MGSIKTSTHVRGGRARRRSDAKEEAHLEVWGAGRVYRNAGQESRLGINVHWAKRTKIGLTTTVKRSWWTSDMDAPCGGLGAALLNWAVQFFKSFTCALIYPCFIKVTLLVKWIWNENMNMKNMNIAKRNCYTQCYTKVILFVILTLLYTTAYTSQYAMLYWIV